MNELVEKTSRINVADKFMCYSTVFFCLIYCRYELPFALNLAMGFVAGGMIFNFLINFYLVKKILDGDLPERQHDRMTDNEED